jgi:hypothetical protein
VGPPPQAAKTKPRSSRAGIAVLAVVFFAAFIFSTPLQKMAFGPAIKRGSMWAVRRDKQNAALLTGRRAGVEVGVAVGV